MGFDGVFRNVEFEGNFLVHFAFDTAFDYDFALFAGELVQFPAHQLDLLFDFLPVGAAVFIFVDDVSDVFFDNTPVFEVVERPVARNGIEVGFDGAFGIQVRPVFPEV